MMNNNLFFVGEAVGVYSLTTLQISKISLIENCMNFGEKSYLVGRVLGYDESCIYKTIPENSLLISTISGFILSLKKNDILKDENGNIDEFLKREEFLTLSDDKEPYNGRLVKKVMVIGIYAYKREIPLIYT